jgi:hypothetical protein
MEKTYTILDHDRPMSGDEIRQMYKGHWVYITNAVFNEYNGLVSGIPVVIGATTFDGVDDGIYKAYKSAEYGERTDMNLLPNRGFISSLRIVGDPVG